MSGRTAAGSADVDPGDAHRAGVGRSSVVRMLIVVVLPALLGPSTPGIRPPLYGQADTAQRVDVTE